MKLSQMQLIGLQLHVMWLPSHPLHCHVNVNIYICGICLDWQWSLESDLVCYKIKKSQVSKLKFNYFTHENMIIALFDMHDMAICNETDNQTLIVILISRQLLVHPLPHFPVIWFLNPRQSSWESLSCWSTDPMFYP